MLYMNDHYIVGHLYGNEFLFIKAFMLEPLFISLMCVLVSKKKKKGSYPINASALKSYNHTILFLNDIDTTQDQWVECSGFGGLQVVAEGL